MIIRELNKKVFNKKPKHEVEEMVNKLKKEYEKPIKGRFEFSEAKGGEFSFSDRQYPGMPIMVLTIKDGETCIIPIGIAKRLNNTVQRVRCYRNSIPESGRIIRGVPETYDSHSRVKFIPESVL